MWFDYDTPGRAGYKVENGQQVAKINNPNVTYAWGNFAMYVRACQTYNLTATFDDFAFWQVPYLK